jgi:16S rRNA (cytidine1402-2'-O)-methyltransferase
MIHLYLVPTPIGNLKDITLRALDVLKEVDLILCEDTRTSGKLLHHYNIQNKLQSYHQHNEHRITTQLVERMQAGESMALISDAGTPAISDPGYLLLRECLKEHLKVECLPGPTALIPALVNSGLPAYRFVFEGFLPHKKGRQSRIKALENEEKTILFYESPHRLLRTLRQLLEFLGDRQVSVSRELTKMHEETVRGLISEVITYFENHTLKGELVIVLAGNSKK